MVHFNVAAYRHKVCLRKIVHLRACFSRRWNPADSKAEYLKTFSLESWNSLSVASKQKHSLQSCTACDCNYSLQIAHIPIRSKSLKRKSLKNNSQQKELGWRILTELNPICKQAVRLDLSGVLIATPESGVQKKKTRKELRNNTVAY